jgi:hypothetical protein
LKVQEKCSKGIPISNWDAKGMKSIIQKEKRTRQGVVEGNPNWKMEWLHW